MGETIPFPDNSYEKLWLEAYDELAEWVSTYLDAGIDPVSMVGLLETYKFSITYNLMEDVE